MALHGKQAISDVTLSCTLQVISSPIVARKNCAGYIEMPIVVW